jgi:probable phosphoglycerate mutase
MKLYVIRHGETNENQTGIMQGNMDTELNTKGREEAKKLREKVKKANIDIVVVSPKKRTIETADIVAPDIEKVYDYRLLSRDHGEFEGLRRDEINLKDYWNIKKNNKYERAESVGSLYERVESLLRDIKIKYKDKNVLLVTHSGICRILYYYFNGIPEDGDLLKYESHNCSFEEYELV